MVLLTGALRPHNPREAKLQALEGWQLLVGALAQGAPEQLGGVVHQVWGGDGVHAGGSLYLASCKEATHSK
jgi:hypothetical protein